MSWPCRVADRAVVGDTGRFFFLVISSLPEKRGGRGGGLITTRQRDRKSSHVINEPARWGCWIRWERGRRLGRNTPNPKSGSTEKKHLLVSLACWS